MYENCDECGYLTCQCDEPAEGHECKLCGYVPTHRELQNGTCPECEGKEATQRFRTQIVLLCEEYGIPVPDGPGWDPNTEVELYRDEEGWHVSDPDMGDEWAPKDDETALRIRSRCLICGSEWSSSLCPACRAE